MRITIIIAYLFAASAAAAPVEVNTSAIKVETRQILGGAGGPVDPNAVHTSYGESEGHGEGNFGRRDADVEARQARTIRVQLSNDATDTAVQRNIPANGQRISIRANFAGLGNPLIANRALVVGSGAGSCNIFSDTNAQQRVATITAGAADARFGATNLQNGIIICQ